MLNLKLIIIPYEIATRVFNRYLFLLYSRLNLLYNFIPCILSTIIKNIHKFLHFVWIHFENSMLYLMICRFTFKINPRTWEAAHCLVCKWWSTLAYRTFSNIPILTVFVTLNPTSVHRYCIIYYIIDFIPMKHCFYYIV